MKIGIPKTLYYYYISGYIDFFKKLNIEIVTFDTNKEIVKFGNKIANDEMCLSLKIFLGHVEKLKDKCDYILVPNINNYGINDQMCANFQALYNLVNNLFNVKILTFDIDYIKDSKIKEGLIKIGQSLGSSKKDCIKAYKETLKEYNSKLRQKILSNMNKLNSTKKKVLLISHPYNMYDEYIGKPIIKYLENLNCEIIYCDLFEKDVLNNMSKFLSYDLYWKYSKENIGSIILCNEKIDGILFLTTFPCGLDSLVNELVMRKISKPYLNLVIDDMDSLTGIETRIESFVDIIEQD